jgi:hypothetical protein
MRHLALLVFSIVWTFSTIPTLTFPQNFHFTIAMKNSAFLRLTVLSAVALYVGTPNAAFGAFVTQSIGGDATTASIQATVDQFRLELGNPNNGNAAGPLFGGRREINWDGGGAATTPSGTPFSGFLNNRGALFTTPGTGFVQAPLTGFDTTFANPTYSTTFAAFSPQRLFSPISSNVTDVSFFLPGSAGAVPATVGGFGAVFSDVDLANTTRLEFFDINGNLLFNQSVLPAIVASGGFSFLGASGNAGEQISRVRITTGNSALGPNDGGGVDVVAMDDFLYREPISVPDAGSTLAMLSGALAAIGAVRQRFRQ